MSADYYMAKCHCCNGTGYAGPTGDACAACEGSGEVEVETRRDDEEAE